MCAGDYIPSTDLDPAPFYLFTYSQAHSNWARFMAIGSSMFSYCVPFGNTSARQHHSLAVNHNNTEVGAASYRIPFGAWNGAARYMGGTAGQSLPFSGGPLSARVGIMDDSEYMRGFFPGLLHARDARLSYTHDTEVAGLHNGIGTVSCLYVGHDNEYPFTGNSTGSYNYGGFLFDIHTDWDNWYG